MGDLAGKVGNELAARVFFTVTYGILILYLSRSLGPEQYGLLFLAISIFTVSRLFSELGIAQSASRYVSEYKNESPEQIPNIVSISLSYILLTAFLVSSIFILFPELISSLIGEPALITLLSMGSVYILTKSLYRYYRIIFQGFNDILWSAKLHALEGFATLLFIVVFVELGFGVSGALLGFIIGYAIVTVIGGVVLFYRYNVPTLSHVDTEPGLKRRILEYNIPLTATRLSDVVDRQVDKILIGFFLNPSAVGFYVLGKQIVSFVEIPAKSIGFATGPQYGEQKGMNDLSNERILYGRTIILVSLLYLPVAATLIIISDPAIRIVFGANYEGAIIVVQILTLFVLFEGVVQLSNQPLKYLGRARSLAILKGFTSSSNLVLNIALIPIYGVVGAAVATVITHGIYAVGCLYLIHTELQLNFRTISNSIIKTLFITIIIFSVAYWLESFVDSVFSLIGYSVIMVIVWTVLVYLSGEVDFQVMINKYVQG